VRQKLFKVERIRRKINFVYAPNETAARDAVRMSPKNEEAAHHLHSEEVVITELEEVKQERRIV
jgi:hypothetical protein